MRIFTLAAIATCALALSGTNHAQLPARHVAKAKTVSAPDHKLRTLIKSSKPLKSAPVDEEPVFDQPEGEVVYYARNCMSYTTDYYEATRTMEYGTLLRSVVDGDGQMWMCDAVSGFLSEGWYKAEKTGNKIVLHLPQVVGYDWDWNDDEIPIYLVPLEYKLVTVDGEYYNTFVPAENLDYTFILGEDGSLTPENPSLMLGLCSWGTDPTVEDGSVENYVWTGYGDTDIAITPAPMSELIVPDANLPVEKWVWADDYDLGFANVIITDDNTIYASGMNRSIPDAYIKGRIEDGKAIFPSNQFMGIDMNLRYVNYFWGATITYEYDEYWDDYILHGTAEESATFDYDADQKLLTLTDGYVISSSKEHFYPLFGYDSVELMYQDRNPQTPPCEPTNLEFDPDSWDDPAVSMTISNVDTEGNYLDTKNLYFEVFVDGELYTFTNELYWPDIVEPTTEIPYSLDGYCFFASGTFHTFYLYMPVKDSIGIRTVYVNENGEKVYSPVATMECSGIENVAVDKSVDSVVYHDLSGRELSAPAKGFVIRTTRFTDGSVRTDKVLMR